MSDKPNVPAPTLQPQENITQAQVTHLLNMFIPACNFLLAAQMHELEESVGGKLDGGARMAVENTVVNICNRFDNLLADKRRWTLANHASLEDSFKQVYLQHARMVSEQANAYAEINSPHHKLKPSLIKVPEGSWIAYLGSLEHLEEAIVGVGNCPADAIAAFDAMFSGQVPEKLQEWLASRGVDLNNPQTEQTSNEQQTQSLDTTGPSGPETSPRSRKVKPRNRKRTGPDGQERG